MARERYIDTFSSYYFNKGIKKDVDFTVYENKLNKERHIMMDGCIPLESVKIFRNKTIFSFDKTWKVDFREYEKILSFSLILEIRNYDIISNRICRVNEFSETELFLEHIRMGKYFN